MPVFARNSWMTLAEWAGALSWWSRKFLLLTCPAAFFALLHKADVKPQGSIISWLFDLLVRIRDTQCPYNQKNNQHHFHLAALFWDVVIPDASIERIEILFLVITINPSLISSNNCPRKFWIMACTIQHVFANFLPKLLLLLHQELGNKFCWHPLHASRLKWNEPSQYLFLLLRLFLLLSNDDHPTLLRVFYPSSPHFGLCLWGSLSTDSRPFLKRLYHSLMWVELRVTSPNTCWIFFIVSVWVSPIFWQNLTQCLCSIFSVITIRFLCCYNDVITQPEYFIFNVKCTIWLKGYQNDNHIEPSEQVDQTQCLFLAAVVLMALCGCRSGNP